MSKQYNLNANHYKTTTKVNNYISSGWFIPLCAPE